MKLKIWNWRWIFGLSIGLGTLLALSLFALTEFIWYPGITPQQSAKIFLNDYKFGFRAIPSARFFGDRFLIELEKQSDNFSTLNARNYPWLGSVLVNLSSPLGKSVAEDLFHREAAWPKITGAYVLSSHRQLNGRSDWQSAAISFSELCKAHGESTVQNTACDPEAVTYAVKVAGLEKTTFSFQYVRSALASHYSHVQEEACGALIRIGDPSAIPVLKEVLPLPHFYAVVPGMMALLAFGSKDAIPLGINRIDSDLSQLSLQNLLKTLQSITGQKFGREKKAWEQWWEKVGQTWKVPPKYLMAHITLPVD